MSANITPESAAYRKTTFGDIRAGAESREYEVVSQTLEYPSSIVWHISCPWCGGSVKAYLWSLSGGGKRCECGAVFSAQGVAYKKKGGGE